MIEMDADDMNVIKFVNYLLEKLKSKVYCPPSIEKLLQLFSKNDAEQVAELPANQIDPLMLVIPKPESDIIVCDNTMEDARAFLQNSVNSEAFRTLHNYLKNHLAIDGCKTYLSNLDSYQREINKAVEHVSEEDFQFSQYAVQQFSACVQQYLSGAILEPLYKNRIGHQSNTADEEKAYQDLARCFTLYFQSCGCYTFPEYVNIRQGVPVKPDYYEYYCNTAVYDPRAETNTVQKVAYHALQCDYINEYNNKKNGIVFMGQIYVYAML